MPVRIEAGQRSVLSCSVMPHLHEDAVLLLFVAPDAPVVAEAKGVMFFVHVALVVVSAALLLAHVAASLLYIAQEALLKAKRPLSALPSLDACDRVGRRVLAWGFGTLTGAILTGALAAHAMRGHFFAWTFPEVFALLTWGIFGTLLAARARSGWRGRKPAGLSLVGFLVLLVVFFWVRTG